jgi:putative hydrolase of the HAD superfamily
VSPGIGALWTDFGGVLTPPIDRTMAAFCGPLGLAPDLLRRAMHQVGRSYGTDAMAPLDTPLVGEREWTRQVETALQDDFGVSVDLSDFAGKWFANRETNEGWIAALRRVRASGRFVGMLSNMVPSWDEHWRRMVPPGELFDDLVLSFEVGCRKPEPAIFALAARRAGEPPARCLLVDDLDENCAAAEAAAWQAIHFTDTGAAVERLDHLLAPVDIHS